MSTISLPKGRSIIIDAIDEVTYATAPGGNWTRTVAYGPLDIGEKQGFEDDPILGAGLTNAVDTTQPAPALPSAGGNITVPLDTSHLGYWLKRTFGAPVDTGSSPDYVHTFTSGAEVLPSFAMEVKKAAALYYQTLGCAISKMTFNASRKSGYDKVTLEVLAAKELKATSSGAGTPVAMVARAPVAASLPLFKLNGSAAGQVLGLDAVYDNKLVGLNFLSGDPHIAGIERDAEATFTGTLKVRFNDATYHDLGISGATFAGELDWIVTSARSLSLAMPLMRIERTPIVVQGPGGIEVDFPFRCEQDGSNPMLTATLKSAVATF